MGSVSFAPYLHPVVLQTRDRGAIQMTIIDRAKLNCLLAASYPLVAASRVPCRQEDREAVFAGRPMYATSCNRSSLHIASCNRPSLHVTSSFLNHQDPAFWDPIEYMQLQLQLHMVITVEGPRYRFLPVDPGERARVVMALWLIALWENIHESQVTEGLWFLRGWVFVVENCRRALHRQLQIYAQARSDDPDLLLGTYGRKLAKLNDTYNHNPDFAGFLAELTVNGEPFYEDQEMQP